MLCYPFLNKNLCIEIPSHDAHVEARDAHVLRRDVGETHPGRAQRRAHPVHLHDITFIIRSTQLRFGSYEPVAM